MRRVLFAALAGAGGVAAAVAACSAFSLHDVVPPSDAGVSRDSSPPSDAPPPDASDASDASEPSDASECDGADPCSCSFPPTLVTIGVGGLDALRLYGGYVYLVASQGASSPSVYRVPVAGFDGGPPEFLGQVESWGGGFTVDPSYAYYVNGNSTPQIARIPDDGGSVDLFTKVLPLAPADLAVTAGGFYWTNGKGEVCTGALDGSIRAGDSGCGGQPLWAGDPEAGAYSNHLCLTDAGIWLGINSPGQIFRIAFDGGGSFVSGARGLASGVACTDTDLFYFSTHDVQLDAGAVYRQGEDGGPHSVVVTAPVIDTFAVDATNVYYIEGQAQDMRRAIYEVSQAGGPSKLLACDSPRPALLGVDDTYVYWGSQDGTIKRASK